MAIIIKPIDASTVRYLLPFLKAVVVNKSLTFSTHIGTYLAQYQKLGISYFADAQKRHSISYKWQNEKMENGFSKEDLVLTGNTKDQAEFRDLSVEAHMTGRGNILQNIHALKYLSAAKYPWKGKHTTPFFYFNKKWQFFRPGEYYKNCSADPYIWKSEPAESIDIKEANKLLLITPAKCQNLLKRQYLDIGTMMDNKKKGLLAKWR